MELAVEVRLAILDRLVNEAEEEKKRCREPCIHLYGPGPD